jgi:hypothetical protein
VGCIDNLAITLGISNAYCCNSWVFDITREDKEGGLSEDIFFVVVDALVVIILESVLIFGLISAQADLYRNNDAAKMIKTLSEK